MHFKFRNVYRVVSKRKNNICICLATMGRKHNTVSKYPKKDNFIVKKSHLADHIVGPMYNSYYDTCFVIRFMGARRTRLE